MTEHARSTTGSSSTGTSTGTKTPVERYCDDLLLALRLRDVPGARIGAVLAEVRDHLAASGEDPVEAFGTPEQYASALTGAAATDCADHPGRPGPSRVVEWVRNTAMTAGILCAIQGGKGLVAGERAELTEVQLLIPAAVSLLAPLLVDAVGASRRAAAIGWGALVLAVVAALGVGHALLGPLLSVRVPALALLVPGALALIAGLVALVRAADPVVDPLQEARSVAAQRRRDGVLLALLWLPLLAAAALLVASSAFTG
ncbi:HAAS signaling domain-containing protein [Kineococcus sp. SYSU DK005]|uniref:HAAS signaling domain-containing protein n=1 Tax=Kineococcus sp. SYSU DK005 TaxID=3383126 RepID=UPI003D7DF5AF